MAFKIDIQHAMSKSIPISEQQIVDWAELTLNHQNLNCAELTIRIVDAQEMSELNGQYRKKDGPTNVLSFPCELPRDIILLMDYPLLGDIIICPDVLLKEALEQGKILESHWAHIIIHGILHLLGFDHIQPDEEKIMQSIEIEILQQLKIANPYEYNE